MPRPSFQDRLVASERTVKGTPSRVARLSASAPRKPMKSTLFCYKAKSSVFCSPFSRGIPERVVSASPLPSTPGQEPGGHVFGSALRSRSRCVEVARDGLAAPRAMAKREPRGGSPYQSSVWVGERSALPQSVRGSSKGRLGGPTRDGKAGARRAFPYQSSVRVGERSALPQSVRGRSKGRLGGPTHDGKAGARRAPLPKQRLGRQSGSPEGSPYQSGVWVGERSALPQSVRGRSKGRDGGATRDGKAGARRGLPYQSSVWVGERSALPKSVRGSSKGRLGGPTRDGKAGARRGLPYQSSVWVGERSALPQWVRGRSKGRVGGPTYDGKAGARRAPLPKQRLGRGALCAPAVGAWT